MTSSIVWNYGHITIPRHLRDVVITEYGVAAVSYTHLRAHETVLDLVCRLLLEKKNTQRHTHDNASTKHKIQQHKLRRIHKSTS